MVSSEQKLTLLERYAHANSLLRSFNPFGFDAGDQVMKPGGIAVVFLIICVVCYFAFPIAFVIPLMLVFGRV
ncbi:MAG TPA: hypothetical protein PKO06_18915, partial [Candidatus Ozemobacteraceae bacterium]|nr:hypothetical protein [Candidatus Ozemobacteraceae bacterium]